MLGKIPKKEHTGTGATLSSETAEIATMDSFKAQKEMSHHQVQQQKKQAEILEMLESNPHELTLAELFRTKDQLENKPSNLSPEKIDTLLKKIGAKIKTLQEPVDLEPQDTEEDPREFFTAKSSSSDSESLYSLEESDEVPGPKVIIQARTSEKDIQELSIPELEEKIAKLQTELSQVKANIEKTETEQQSQKKWFQPFRKIEPQYAALTQELKTLTTKQNEHQKLLDQAAMRLKFLTDVADFKQVPFAKKALSKGESIYRQANQIIQRLRRGELGTEESSTLNLQENTIAKVLSSLELTTSLEKLETDRQELTKHLDSLKKNLERLSEVKEGVKALLDDETEYSKRDSLDSTFKELKNRDDPETGTLLKEIDEIERTLNLIARMKKVAVLQEIIKKRTELQKAVNTKSKYLQIAQSFSTGYLLTPDDFKNIGLEPTTKHQTFDLGGFRIDLSAELGRLKEKTNTLDQIFEQELLRLQDQDDDPVTGKLPIDYWTPWLLDQVRDGTGLFEGSRRLGQTRAFTLVQEKLIANSGITNAEAYTKLGEALLKVLSFRDPEKQKAEIIKLIRLPRWLYENPQIARQLIGNIQLALSEFYSSGTLLDKVKNYLITDDFVSDILASNRQNPNHDLTPEAIAFLHLSSSLPVLISTIKAATRAETWKEVPGEAFFGAVKGICTKLASQGIADYVPGTGKLIEAIERLKKGDSPTDVATGFVKRNIFSDFMGFVRDVKDLGVRKAFVEIKENFKSWWKHSSKKEKTWRFVSKPLPALGLIAAGATLSATGVGLVVGIPLITAGIGLAAVGFVMRWVNDRFFFRDSTAQIENDRQRRRRDARLMPNQDYLLYLQKTRPMTSN